LQWTVIWYVQKKVAFLGQKYQEMGKDAFLSQLSDIFFTACEVIMSKVTIVMLRQLVLSFLLLVCYFLKVACQLTKTIHLLTDYSKRNPVISVKKNTKIGEVIQEMDKQHIHRVVVLDKDGNIEQLITQSFLVESIYVSLDMVKEFGDCFVRVFLLQSLFNAFVFLLSLLLLCGPQQLHSNPDASLGDLGYAVKKQLICCNGQDVTIEACSKMFKFGYTGLGVVNNEGALIGCLGSNAMRVM
jgi:CBS domain-containing protein